MSPFIPGAVLLDNTTVFGAAKAYRSWPIDPGEWTSGSLAIDLRSLMDLIEALILHEQIVLDAASRSMPAWPGLLTVANRPGEVPVVNDDDLVYYGNEDSNATITASLMRGALEKTCAYLRTGSFELQAEYLQFARGGATLPSFYTSTSDFEDKLVTRGSARDNASALDNELAGVMEDFHEMIEPASTTAGNYALFMYNGFYYQALAHFHSISYVPHTWRAPMIAADLEAPSVSFARYVAHMTSAVRDEVAAQLDNEFGGGALRSEFPPFASYVASQARSRGELLSIAVEIRNTPEATSFRKWLQQIQGSITSQTDLPKIAQAQRDLVMLVADLRQRLGIPLRMGVEPSPGGQQVTLRLAVPLTGVSAETAVDAHAPSWLRSLLHRRTHLVFLRDVASEAVRVAPFLVAFQELAPDSAASQQS